MLLLSALALVLPDFFSYIQAKPGVFPPDPVIPVLGPVDLSLPIFSVLYSVIVLAVISVVRFPVRLLQGLFAYAFLLMLRMATMTLFTLDPPPDAIALIDPVTGPFYPADVPFLKDLFFSGHTATLALMALLTPWKPLRVLAWCATLAVGAMVVAQHVHWTVDVVAAPFAAWAVRELAAKWMGVITPPRKQAAS